jgi:hypothetical protein
MPPAVKRQRSSVRTRLAAPKEGVASNIAQFTRVSKSIGKEDVKTNAIATSLPALDAKLSALAPSPRKRKAARAIQDDGDSSADEGSKRPRLFKTTQEKERSIPSTKKGRGRPPKKAPSASSSLKRGRSASVSDSDQSTINTDKLFKRLRLESSPSRESSPLTANTSVADSEIELDLDILSAPTLPNEVLDLIDLHASFLKTLTLHYAHNGSHVPVDLRVLCPNVARTWGKKGVRNTDIQVCLGVLGMKTNEPLFTLLDYGRGKICIEIDQKQFAGLLEENELNNTFRSNIKLLWSQYVSNGAASSAASFTKNLPKTNIILCESVTRASAVIAKGQQRLADFRQGMAAKKLESDAKSTTSSASVDSLPINPDGSKMSLLDRIRLKQLQKTSLPAGLSPAEMQRRAALQRVDEVAALIGMLSRASSGGMGRISFPMPVMLQKLKDSFRMGISKDEGAACVRIIAKEVASEWIGVVTINGKENVVIETDLQLSKAKIAQRVQAITAKF